MDKENKEPIETGHEAPAPAGNQADDFFTSKDADQGLKNFLSHMKQPVEEVEAPPSFDFMDEDEEISSGGDEVDDEMLSHFDYTEEHKLTAEFMLIQVDKALAFSFSLISGMEMDRYRRRKDKIQSDDYELEIAAALIKKYQMRMSLEWMFASAMIMGYAPLLTKAIQDRKDKKSSKNVS